MPGVGVKSARRIIAARKQGKLDFDGLKRIGVVLKRARYFITCSGKMEVSCSLDEDHITSALIGDERRKIWDIENRNSYRQLSLFDDMHLEEEKNSLLKGSAGKGSSGKCCLWTVMRKYRRNEHDDLFVRTWLYRDLKWYL